MAGYILRLSSIFHQNQAQYNAYYQNVMHYSAYWGKSIKCDV